MHLKYDKVINTEDDVVKYKDSNFAGLKTDQKLTRDYVFIIAKVAINHLSKLILIFALLTYNIKYITIYTVKKKAVWLG